MSIAEQKESEEIKDSELLSEEEAALPISEEITAETQSVIRSKYDNLSSLDKLKFNLKYAFHKLSFLRPHFRSKMVEIVYVSPQEVPKDYILALQKQYPNKEVKVIIPMSGLEGKILHSPVNFNYFYKNREYEASVIKYPVENTNISVYGIYSETFSNIDNPSLIYDFKYMAPYAKCARIFAQKLNPDIVHSENIPFYLGAEFEPKKRASFKLIQTYHHQDMYPELEPFWVAINLADKSILEKITNDRIIRKYLAKLFNLKNVKNSKTTDKCLDYFYDNFENFRNSVEPDNKLEQNLTLISLNKRIIKMFPSAAIKKRRTYNQQNYTSKLSNRIILTSDTPVKDNVYGKKMLFLQSGFTNLYDDKIIYTYTRDNFRNIRTINKSYVQREFGRIKIQSKFTDKKLLQDEEVNICGYLDTIRTSALIFATFDENATEEDFKSVVIPVLKAFELSKDIQFVLNVKNASNNSYIKSLIDFFETQHVFDGRWLYIDGKINLSQMLAASNIYLCHAGRGVNDEDVLYTALKYGCVPVVFRKDGKNDLLKDIFDDMNDGCCFKLSSDSSCEMKDYEELLLKALSFYFNNSSSWNLIIKNAMSYDSSWNFERIAAFNALYDELM